MFHYSLMVVAVSCFPCSALATIQESDLVILEGQQLYTHSIPSLDKVFPDITFPKFEMISTGNRKGYRATWATFQKRLYLVGLEARVVRKKKLQRNNDIIPRHNFPLKVTDWSGTIIQIGRSSSLDADTMTWTDITETTTVTVKKGVVTNTKVAIERKPRNTSNVP